MKKYSELSELIKDYRRIKGLTQLDLSVLLDVDNRTISRWENGESLINPDHEDDVCEKLFLPFQVVHNLNSEHPIAIFYDISSRTYSYSLLGTKLVDTGFFKSEAEIEDDRFSCVDDSQYDTILKVKKERSNEKALDKSTIAEAANKLPELNIVINDQAGFHGGHLIFLPLKKSVYQLIKNKEKKESQISLNDLCSPSENEERVFYFYSLYSDSMLHSYYLVSKVLRYFKKHRFSNYIIAGKAYRDLALDMHKEMGLSVIWQLEKKEGAFPMEYQLEGNYDMYLFGKMN